MCRQIALDGPAGAGKSSVARAVAQKLNFIYVDTGAMYRAVAIYLLDNKVDIEDNNALANSLKDVSVDISYIDDSQHVFLNEVDVTGRLRTEETGNMASKSSAKPQVRALLLDLQRKLARENNVVMDGRDIGTVILPNADLKIFLTASVDERASRRYIQLIEGGEQPENIDIDVIKKEIADRDYRDMHRETAPLKQAEDAVYVDTSDMTKEEVINTICDLYAKCSIK